MHISNSITWGPPFCPRIPGKQTGPSIALRTSAIAAGALLVTGSVLALLGTPVISQLGPIGGWTTLSLGSVAVLMATSFQLVKKERSFLGNYPLTQLSQSQLIVRRVPSKDWIDLSKLAFKWRDIALKKHKHSEQSAPFINSAKVLFDISKKLGKRALGLKPDKGESWSDALVCEDTRGKIQAIALINEKENKLAYLATHPHNLRHPLNEGIEDRTRGAATQIMLALAVNTLKANRPLRLRAIKEATSFYTRLYFEFDAENENPLYDLFPLKLTADKIGELISKKIPPFDQIQPEPTLH